MTGLCARSGPVSSLDESGEWLSLGRVQEEPGGRVEKKEKASARAEPSERKKEKERGATEREREREKRLGCEVNVSSKVGFCQAQPEEGREKKREETRFRFSSSLYLVACL